MVSVVLVLSMFLPIFVQAQDGPPCVGGDPVTGPFCPIDSGLVFLLVAGGAYGIKIVIDSRKAAASKNKNGELQF